MQEAAESASGKNGVPKGPKGTRGIVMLSNDVSWTSPDDKKKKKKWDEDDDEDERSEAPSIHPRNLSYSSQSARALKSPAKRKKKKSAWPPRGEDDEEEEGGSMKREAGPSARLIDRRENLRKMRSRRAQPGIFAFPRGERH